MRQPTQIFLTDSAPVFVDTSVLFPFSVMDLLLALTENSIHEALWTDELLDEWERVIVREHARTPANAAAVTGAIREWATLQGIGPDRALTGFPSAD